MDSSLFVLASSNLVDGVVSFADGHLVRYLAAFAVTYWLHSMLLLGSAWVLLRTLKPDSHFIRERVWKIAAMTGFVTATVQLSTGMGIPVLSTPASATSASDLAVNGTEVSRLRPRTQDSAEVSRHLATSLTMVQESLNQLGEGLPKTLAESKSRPSESISSDEKPVGNAGPKPSLAPSVTFLPIDDPERLASEAIGVVGSGGPATVEAGRLASDVSRPGSVSESTSNDVISRVVRWLAAAWFSTSLLWFVWQTLRFRRQMRHVRSASTSHRKLLDSICESRGVTRKVRLLRSD
jgi:hypothetical protein